MCELLAHLFCSISIPYDFESDYEFSDAIQAIRGALQHNPQLAACVDVFEVYIVRQAAMAPDDVVEIEEVMLPEIMAALIAAQKGTINDGRQGRLHTLGLGGYDMSTANWSMFQSNFRTAWEALCVSSGITTLRVQDIRKFPLCLVLEYMPHLRRLEMSIYTFDSSSLPSLDLELSNAPFPKLTELKVDDYIIILGGRVQQPFRSYRDFQLQLSSSLEVLDCWPRTHMILKMGISKSFAALHYEH